MRFNEGHIRIWLEDMSRYFYQSPQDYALFSWLLMNCHYKNEPYCQTIRGKTFDKKQYSKEWIIRRGDFFGSKVEIKLFWKYDYRTQKKIMASLVEKGLIQLLLEDPALIVRINHYDHFAWRGKSNERPPIPLPSVELPTPLSNITYPPSVELPTPSVILLPADIGDSTNLCQVDAKLPTKSSSTSELTLLKEREREEIPREREGGSLLKNVISNLGEGMGKQMGSTVSITPIPPRIRNNPPPEDEKALGDEWYSYACEKASNTRFNVFEFYAAISDIKSIKRCSTERLREAYLHLASWKDGRLSMHFISPCQYSERWGAISKLDALFNSLEKEEKKTKPEQTEKLTSRQMAEILFARQEAANAKR